MDAESTGGANQTKHQFNKWPSIFTFYTNKIYYLRKIITTGSTAQQGVTVKGEVILFIRNKVLQA